MVLCSISKVRVGTIIGKFCSVYVATTTKQQIHCHQKTEITETFLYIWRALYRLSTTSSQIRKR